MRDDKRSLLEKYAAEVAKISDFGDAVEYTIGFADDHKLRSEDMRGYVPERLVGQMFPDIFDMIDAPPRVTL